MVFTGAYDHTIDAKNRLAIPSEVRALMQAALKGKDKPLQLYVTLGEKVHSRHCLALYAERDFRKRAAEMLRSQNAPEQLLNFERWWFSMARLVELDGAGRIRLPENLIELAGLGGEVILLGVNDHMEIHDRAAWQEQVRQAINDPTRMVIANPRRAIGWGRQGSQDGMQN